MRTASLLPVLFALACGASTPASTPTAPPAASTARSTEEPAASTTPAPPPNELRATALAAYQAEDWGACAQAYASVAEDPGATATDAYNGACCFALNDEADRAFELLERTAALGWRDVDHAQADSDFASLHDDTRWPQAVARFEANLDRYLASINQELYALYQADQGDRRPGPEGIDWAVVSGRDDERQARVLEIIAAGEAKVADDWFHAAMVMQHGDTPEDYQRAHEWALRAVELAPDHGTARWLAAAAKDRWLMKEGKPQLYGTQFVKEGERWVLYEVDPRVTDQERAEWNVPPLAEAQRRAEQMNQR